MVPCFVPGPDLFTARSPSISLFLRASLVNLRATKWPGTRLGIPSTSIVYVSERRRYMF